MIGNDIVDLNLAKKESDWKRPRFLDKIFTQKEQQLISTSAKPDQMVWLLWSMKESAYKLYVQHFEKRFFAPKKFECEISKREGNKFQGVVYISGFQCFTCSIVTKCYIYSIANKDKKNVFLSNEFFLKSTTVKAQHSIVNHRAKKHFADLSGTPFEEIRILKNEIGVPFFYAEKQNLKVPVSTTHHGRFGAFAYHKVI